MTAHGADRAEALARLDTALAGTAVLGLGTDVGFLRALHVLTAPGDGVVRGLRSVPET